MVFHWGLRNRKSPQVSRTLLGILADLSNNSVDWMVPTCPLISKSSCPFINTLWVVSSAPITVCIKVIFMFHSFLFNFLARSAYFSPPLSFNFTLWSPETEKSTIRQVLFLFIYLFLTITRSGRWPRLGSLFVSPNTREVWSCHFPGGILGCADTICQI